MVEYLEMLQKISWSYVKTNPGLDFDDCFSEACIACLEAEKNYDPDKAKKSTFFWKTATNKLNDLIKAKTTKDKNEKYIDTTLQLEDGPDQQLKTELELRDPDPIPEQALIAKENWEEKFNSFSPAAQEICKMIIEEEIPLFFPGSTPKLCRGDIFRMLRENKNWSWPKIWETFKELKQAFNK